MPRIYNFSAGPCTLPVAVLEEARDQMLDYQSTGMSLVEMSHRSKTVVGVFDEAQARMRSVLGVPDTHHVLFVGGGATFQFGMLAMNLLAGGQTADYTHSGAWAKKAIADAKTVGNVNLVFDGSEADYMTLPDPAAVKSSADSAYLHFTSNETIGGVQWKAFPQCEAPLVADMSSDFLSRPFDLEPFGMVYAGAQKNIGPAGLCVVIIRDDLVQRCPGNLVNYLNYANHVKGESMLNTPPVFQVYMVSLVLKWLEDHGGLAWAQEMATKRSMLLYDAIQKHAGFYRCPVDERYRSQMNVVFRLPSEELEARFVTDAEAQGMSGLKGHRSVGGCRASIYNAMPVEGAEALASFMDAFAAKHG